MKFILYLIIIALLALGVHWLLKNMFGGQETAPAVAAPAGGNVPVAAAAGASSDQNSSPINKTRVMQRVHNLNDQHNRAVSRQ